MSDASEPRADLRMIAVLVDGDNVSPDSLPLVIAEASKYGSLAVRRVYGDWTSSRMSSWKQALQLNAFQPVQQFANTTGKNATDSALIIEAMDLLHAGRMDGFCIVSSDSDYTRLATRIREQGLLVVGIGERKTPKALVNACNVFVYLENVAESAGRAPLEVVAEDAISVKDRPQATGPQLKDLLCRAVDMVARDDGWADLAAVGIQLRSIDPGFDTRTYGYRRLADAIKATDELEIRYSNPEGPGPVFVRRKE